MMPLEMTAPNIREYETTYGMIIPAGKHIRSPSAQIAPLIELMWSSHITARHHCIQTCDSQACMQSKGRQCHKEEHTWITLHTSWAGQNL